LVPDKSARFERGFYQRFSSLNSGQPDGISPARKRQIVVFAFAYAPLIDANQSVLG